MGGMFILQFLILTAVVSGTVIFFLHRTLIKSTDGALTRLAKDAEDARRKQAELDEKLKKVSEELEQKKAEAVALADKMTQEAEEKAKEEREKMINKAREEGEEIIAKAQQTKDKLRSEIQKELEMKSIEQALEMVNTVFSAKIKGLLDEHLAEDFLKNLEKVDMSRIGADITSADIVAHGEVKPKVKDQIAAVLKQKLKRDITLKVVNDASIVGGFILKFGSLTLDGSLKNSFLEAGEAIRAKVEQQ